MLISKLIKEDTPNSGHILFFDNNDNLKVDEDIYISCLLARKNYINIKHLIGASRHG